MTKEDVRRELAQLRRLSQNADAVCRARERRRRRMELLHRKEDPAGDTVFAAFENEIDRLVDMEARYIAASGHFEAIDREILLDCLIGGKTYRALGDALGYSTENIRKRAQRIVKRLVEIL